MSKKITTKNLTEVLERAWLNLGDIDTTKIVGPLHDGVFGKDNTKPVKLMEVLLNPDYFHFTCKYLLNVELIPFQAVILKELWNRPFPMLIQNRGGGKTFILGLYAVLKALLVPGSKVVICGAAFRQAKLVFEYAEMIWNNAPVLRDICGNGKSQGPHKDTDRHRLVIGTSTITAIPLGDGSKIRGLRATDLIVDEFASVPKEIYENVIGGFGSVSQEPHVNVRNAAARKKLQSEGYAEAASVIPEQRINKSIISGTAFYDFNNFAAYWKKYKGIIESRGDKQKIIELHEGKDPGEHFDWRDFSIIRIPVQLLPDGFMDMKNVSRAQATSHSSSYLIEFGACFAKDSDGFFKAALVNGCVASDNNLSNPNLSWPNGSSIFSATVIGNKTRTYVYGVDPASENDNFSIVILELHETHSRVVYCWTMTKKRHRLLMGKVSGIDQNFFAFCARKIRDLMKKFPASRIAIDSQGGGYSIAEALHDKDKIQEGEQPLWEYVDRDKPKESDNWDGQHILEMISFSQAEWVSKANHGMKADLEQKILQFPFFDTIAVSEAMIDDNEAGRDYDTLEDCMLEIEALKQELSTIIHTQTGTAQRDRWDTPEEIKNGKKGRQRKDRYSALLMANMVARTISRTMPTVTYNTIGGFSDSLATKKNQGSMYLHAPEWYSKWANEVLARR
jgi:hypothetical protein